MARFRDPGRRRRRYSGTDAGFPSARPGPAPSALVGNYFAVSGKFHRRPLGVDLSEIAGKPAIDFENRCDWHWPNDIDVDAQEVVANLQLSTSAELLLRLRWLAILSGPLRASLAASGGVHTALDGIKALLSGAHAVQMVAAVLQEGPQHFRTMEQGLGYWMARHQYESIDMFRGRLSLQQCSNPAYFERSNYLRVLQTWIG